MPLRKHEARLAGGISTYMGPLLPAACSLLPAPYTLLPIFISLGVDKSALGRFYNRHAPIAIFQPL